MEVKVLQAFLPRKRRRTPNKEVEENELEYRIMGNDSFVTF